jgi:hypothetical protein
LKSEIPGEKTQTIRGEDSPSRLYHGSSSFFSPDAAAHYGSLLAIIAIGVAIRAHYLSLPIKYDEATTFLNYARHPLWDAISDYSAPNNHVLHTLCAHLSLRIFGHHDWALRLPAFIFGCSLVPATYGLARMLSNREAALIAAAMTAGSAKLVEYSVNARGYTLLVLLSLALIALGLRLIRSGGAMAWAAFSGVAALGFFTIPTMLYVYAAVLLWMAANRNLERIFLKRMCVSSLATFLMTAILYLPALLRSGPKAVLFSRIVRPLPFHEFFRQAPTLPSLLWAKWTAAFPGVLLAVLLAGFVVAILREEDVFRLRFSLVMSFAIAVIGLMIVHRVVPFSRVFLFALPIGAIYSSAGLIHMLSRGRSRRLSFVVPVAAVLIAAWMGLAVVYTGCVFASEETGSFQDAAEVLRFLNGATAPDDPVLVIIPVDMPFEYYMQAGVLAWEHERPHKASARLFIVLRDHHGPASSRMEDIMTLSPVSRSYMGPSGPKLAFTSDFTSVYITEGATVDPRFCDVFCYHRDQVARGSTASQQK